MSMNFELSGRYVIIGLYVERNFLYELKSCGKLLSNRKVSATLKSDKLKLLKVFVQSLSSPAKCFFCCKIFASCPKEQCPTIRKKSIERLLILIFDHQGLSIVTATNGRVLLPTKVLLMKIYSPSPLLAISRCTALSYFGIDCFD